MSIKQVMLTEFRKYNMVNLFDYTSVAVPAWAIKYKLSIFEGLANNCFAFLAHTWLIPTGMKCLFNVVVVGTNDEYMQLFIGNI